MAETTKKAAVTEEVLRISSLIKNAVTTDAKAGVITENEPGKVYEASLPEGLTVEVVKTVNNHNGNFVAGTAHALGTIAVDTLKANKDLKEVTGDIKTVGKDHVGITVTRSREYVNRLGGGNETIVKFGVTDATYHHAPGTNSGQLKVVRGVIGELAVAALKGTK